MSLERKAMSVLRDLLPPVVARVARRLRTHGPVTPPASAPVPGPASAPSPVRRIDNLRDLDDALTRAEAAFAVSEDEGRRVLDAFSYVYSEPMPDDPYSDTYREAQMRVYAHVSARPTYDAHVNEHSQFDVTSAKVRPYPYQTGSAEAVGTQLIKQGLIIRHLPLNPNSRVVEFGAGWGNLTMHMARMGHSVTAVEIEPGFVELIRDAAARAGVQIEVLEQDMVDFCPSAPYDAGVFFESLHHCADHVRMLRNLARIVKPDGVVVFATEPIADYPQPWGVRLDGLSVWSMRRFGWLELGFDTSYFLRTLLRFGWLPERHLLPECAGADVIVARRSQGEYDLSRLTLPPDEGRTWLREGPDYRVAGERSLLSCAQDIEVDAVEFCVSNLDQVDREVVFAAGATERNIVVPAGCRYAPLVAPAGAWTGQVVVAAGRHQAEHDLGNGVAVHRIRLYSPARISPASVSSKSTISSG